MMPHAQGSRLHLFSGSIPRSLLRISLPIMAMFLLQTLYSMADAFWLGKLGKEALSAPGISFPILFLFISFGAGFSIAGTTLVAQYTGSGQPDKANLAAGQTLVYLILGAVFVAVIGELASTPILRLVHTPDDVFVNARSYLRIIFVGIPFMALSFVYGALMRGIGDTITPMIVELSANFLNIVLDPFLIFGWGPFPRLEVAGAATVTVFCRVLASSACLVLLASGRRGLRVRWAEVRPRWEYWRRIARIGMPAAVGQSGASLGFMTIQGMVNSFGSVVVSAFTVAIRIIHLLNVPTMGLSAGATALIGQNLGADQVRRAERTVWYAVAMVASVLLIGCTGLAFYSRPFIEFFIDDPQVVAQGQVLFRIVSFSVLFFGIIMVVFSAFQGSGKTSPVMILSISRLWLLRIPIAYILSFVLDWGPLGLWWAMFASNVVISIAGLIWFSRGSWKQKVV